MEDAPGRAGEPAEREPLPAGARAAVVEREQDRDRDRDDRPEDVEDRDHDEPARLGPRVAEPAHCLGGLPGLPGRAQVVEHQQEQHRREQHRQHRAGHLLGALTCELVDLVADQVRLRGGRDEVGRVVVAEHRQGDEHAAGEDPGHRERQRHAPERAERARAEIARRLDLPLVDPVERREQRQDQERDVAVDERDDHGRALPVEPAASGGEQPEPEEQPLDPEVVEDPRAPAVRREQVDPGEHPHQVVDPERHDQQEQDEPLPAAAVARREVGDGIADQEREGHRDRDELDRADRDTVRNCSPCQMLRSTSSDVADVPVERVPERHRLGERVLVAERDRDDCVEGDEEEDREPHDAGKGEQPPGPARPISAGLELRPGVVPVRARPRR